jgi:hypothetical protein
MISLPVSKQEDPRCKKNVFSGRWFWMKTIFPSKFNLEYGGTFTKLFMHVSSRNMFPTTRNLQIRVRSIYSKVLTVSLFIDRKHFTVILCYGPLVNVFVSMHNGFCAITPVINEGFFWNFNTMQNSIWNMAVPLLSYSCMFQVEICSQQLEICKSVCKFIVLAIIVETD